jgi:hypothetical protein
VVIDKAPNSSALSAEDGKVCTYTDTNTYCMYIMHMISVVHNSVQGGAHHAVVPAAQHASIRCYLECIRTVCAHKCCIGVCVTIDADVLILSTAVVLWLDYVQELYETGQVCHDIHTNHGFEM